MQLRRVGRLVEVEVAREDLVRALPAQHHLAARGLEPPGQQEHGGGGAHGRDVEGLEVVDDVRDGVEALLGGEGEAVVAGADVLGHLLRSGYVRAALEADAEGPGYLGGNMEYYRFDNLSPLISDSVER